MDGVLAGSSLTVLSLWKGKNAESHDISLIVSGALLMGGSPQ